MTYRSIDKERFSYLLRLGVDEFELRRFFSDCRAQLIQHGGKVQNLPYGPKARVRALAHELPTTTDDVIGQWFSKHITMSDPESADTIVETFRLHEEVGETIEEEEARRLARSCLVHLFKSPTPAIVMEFLKTPIGGNAKRAEKTPESEEMARPAYSENLANLLVGMMQGQDIDEFLDGLPSDIAKFAIGLQAAAQGRTKEALQALEALPVGSTSRTRLDQYLKQQEARGPKAPTRGLAICEFGTSDGSFDYAVDEILGYCTNSDFPNAVFVHPIAVVRAATTQLLSPEKSRKLFPETGDVMAFAGPGNPRQPRRGEVGIWRVIEHQTNKATRFHITGDLRTVYELIAVPFSSTDYDSVREFLKEHAERTATKILQPLLFVLSDELIVGPRPDRSDLSKEEAFESGLLSWNSLAGYRFEGRVFVLGPLPKEQGVYECAGIAASVRKLLRPHIGPGKSTIGLTKAQLSELVRFLGSSESDLNATRMQRIRAELERIGENQEMLDALVHELLAHPSVTKRIDEMVEQSASMRVAEKNLLLADIARLQKERADWEEKIRKQKEDHRKLEKETSKIVRTAFEKARTDGVATLAELAIFQELTRTNSQRNGEASGSIGPFQPTVRELAKSDSNAVSILRACRIPNQLANAFVATGELAFSTGLILCVHGIAARQIVQRWAQSIGKGFLIDSTIGLVDDSPLRSVVNSASRPEVIAVLDANLSALDIYARPISDAVIDALSKDQDSRPTAVLFSMSDGIAHLPVPKSFERLSIAINLDAKYDFSVTNVNDMMQRVFDPEDGLLRSKLWGPAVERLRATLSKLDEQSQALVLPVLTSM